MPSICVEVVHAMPTRQIALRVELPEGATVRDAVMASGILEAAGMTPTALDSVGIWNRVVTADSLLSDGDRVELYRPLVADPKDARRLRAKSARQR